MPIPAIVILAMQIISAIMAVVSAVMMIINALHKNSTPAALAARTGMEVAVEGKPEYISKAYGRCKLGGLRAWHATSSNFKYTEPNSDKQFHTGASGTDPTSYTARMRIAGVVRNVTIHVDGAEDGLLTRGLKGSKNEFLFFQQALAIGKIHRVIDVIIDDSRYLDDPQLGNIYDTDDVPWNKHKPRAAMRIDVHYNGGNDTIAYANFGDRKSARFTGLCYASVVVRLDKDSPQFGDVPNLQFLAECSEVKYVVKDGDNYSLSTGEVYTNNPSICLLDYLMDRVVGGRVRLDELDLESFYYAATVCGPIWGESGVIVPGTVVAESAAVGGKFFNPTDKAFAPVTHRPLPLYECNRMTNTAKPVRDNVEAMLGTMSDARLIWSQGKYRLHLQYPATNEDLDIVVTITDDDLILPQEVKIKWPDAGQRINYCTVRFHNENEQFKEDSVSWPAKIDSLDLRGIGGYAYAIGSSNYDENTEGGRLLNSYGVWSGLNHTSNQEFNFLVRLPAVVFGDVGYADLLLEFSADDFMDIEIRNYDVDTLSLGSVVYSAAPYIVSGHTQIYKNGDDDVIGSTVSLSGRQASSSNGPWQNLNSDTLRVYDPKFGIGDYVQNDVIISIKVLADDYGKEQGMAATLTQGNLRLWTTRDVTYDNYEWVANDSSIYDAMLAEDDGLELEMDTSQDGVTDYYHALAKAEEIVRTSRTSIGLSFKYMVRGRFAEPGDYVKIVTSSLPIPSPFYARVEAITVAEDGNALLSVTRFDVSQLAWSNKHNVYTTPKDDQGHRISRPKWLNFSPGTKTATLTIPGTLTWPGVPSTGFSHFNVYVHEPQIPASYDSHDPDLWDDWHAPTGAPRFKVIGTTTGNSYNVLGVGGESAMFGVASVTTDGKVSPMTFTDIAAAVDLYTGSIDSNIIITNFGDTISTSSGRLLRSPK